MAATVKDFAAAADNDGGFTFDMTGLSHVSGDLGVASVGTLGSTGLTYSGWTALHDTANGTSCECSSAYKALDGTETSLSCSSAQSKGVGLIYIVEGHADPSTDPPEVTVTTGSSANPDPPSHTPSGGSDDYLIIAPEVHTFLATVSAWPSGYDGTGSQATSAGSACTMGYAHDSITGTSENPGAYTISFSNDWVSPTISVAPAAVAAGSLIASRIGSMVYRHMLVR